MVTVVENIGLLWGIVPTLPTRLVGAEMRSLGELRNCWLSIEDDHISGWGEGTPPAADLHINAAGGTVIPAFCDSHTHIIFAGTREREFEDKIRGLSYEEIARRGGGILNSAARVQQATEQELYEASAERLSRMVADGTGSVEIKSGYGLTLDAEMKMLRVAARLSESSPATIRTTFLCAHALPVEYRGRADQFVDTVCREWIPAVAAEGLAEFVDLFCEEGFFNTTHAAQIMEAGAKHGLRSKIHANQLAFSGGVQAGVRGGALSVDHLESSGQAEIEALLGTSTMPTLLPSAAFFLRAPYPPARQMIESGLGVALATDYNPGTSPSGYMPLVLTLATVGMRMLPEEALAAATINGAYAMGLNDRGTISVGARADLTLLRPMESIAYLPYSFGENCIRGVILGGKTIV
ncbi:MAG: imidazolonepropionase [Tidjanibacter sp.]|nr:imidazolonepropionase [Tidjanibacter sp.]MBR7102259.1 imidazolonepropionase [Tidjanibacter sp.]